MQKDNMDMLAAAAVNLQNWDLESHKIAYAEAFEKRRAQLERQSKVDMPIRMAKTIDPNEE